MIVNRDVLEAEFVPSEILHRHSEIEHLSAVLDPLQSGGRVDGALLYGPTGTGKTCTSQWLLERLEQQHDDIHTTHIDCWSNSSRAAVLHRLNEAVNGPERTRLTRSSPADEIVRKLKHDLEQPFVVILDEADQVEEEVVLYELYETPNVTTLLIANDDAEFFAPLADRVGSRLTTLPRLEFPAYEPDELVSILEERADHGLRPDAIGPDCLEVIARTADGDARVAIGILRNAAEKARATGADRISNEIVLEVADEARTEVRKKTVSSLNRHQRVLLEVLTKHGELSMQALSSHYSEHVDNPRVNRTLRNYLSKMEHYNLVESVGDGRGRKYRATDVLMQLDYEVVEPPTTVD